MSITARQLFYGMYRDAGLVLLEQTGLNYDQEEESRQIFNRWVDSMRLNGLLISHVSRNLFNLVSLQGDYTIGPSGNWNTVPRPVRIERASVVVTNQTPNPEYPLEELTLQDWQNWRLKGLSNTWPASYYYEPTTTNGTIHLLFVPSEANKAAIYLEEPISQISVAAGTPPDYSVVSLEFEPGYQEFIESNLAKTLAARKPGSNISPLTLQTADLTMRRIKIANFRSMKMDSDYPTRGPVLHDGYGNRRW